MKNLIKKIKNPKVLKPLSIILVVMLTLAVYVIYQLLTSRIFIDDSLVDAPITIVNPTVPGVLSEIDVYDGERITKGDLLGVVGGQAVYAESDGIVVGEANTIGASLSLQTALVQIVNPVDIRIAGTIDETKGLSNIHVGQVVSFSIDALPNQKFWGFVDEVSPTAKSTQNAFTISSERPTQQFVVYAKFDSEKYPQIKNGMSAKMVVYTRTN